MADGLTLKYFVLNPSSRDSLHALASRMAMRAYADAIRDENAALSVELREWADRETRTSQEPNQ